MGNRICHPVESNNIMTTEQFNRRWENIQPNTRLFGSQQADTSLVGKCLIRLPESKKKEFTSSVPPPEIEEADQEYINDSGYDSGHNNSNESSSETENEEMYQVILFDDGGGYYLFSGTYLKGSKNALYCTNHKTCDMINVTHPFCKFNDCTKCLKTTKIKIKVVLKYCSKCNLINKNNNTIQSKKVGFL